MTEIGPKHKEDLEGLGSVLERREGCMGWRTNLGRTVKADAMNMGPQGRVLSGDNLHHPGLSQLAIAVCETSALVQVKHWQHCMKGSPSIETFGSRESHQTGSGGGQRGWYCWSQ